MFILEDREAVIRTIIEGRSPNSRHASRTHLVALDWPFEMINVGMSVSIRYVHTTEQLPIF